MDLKSAIKENKIIDANIMNSISVILIANVLGPRGYDNTTQLNCSETEHLSLEEFNEIYQGTVNAGFFIENVYFSEIDFIRNAIEIDKPHLSKIVFNICRNGVGMNKKTVVPAICDLLSIIYTSSGAGQCAIARNKWMFTTILSSMGIRCPISSLDSDKLYGQLTDSDLVICKPNSESASQGISNNSITKLKDVKTNKNTLIQEYIDGYECEVPIITYMGRCIAMQPVGISISKESKSGILTYDDSLENNYGFYDLSENIPQHICDKIKLDAEKAFKILGLENYGRIDFRIKSSTLEYFVIDVSTTPYITKHSSFAFAINELGGNYEDIFKLIIAGAFHRKEN